MKSGLEIKKIAKKKVETMALSQKNEDVIELSKNDKARTYLKPPNPIRELQTPLWMIDIVKSHPLFSICSINQLPCTTKSE